MDYFSYKNSMLHAENVAIEKIAAEVGTPFYCYSTATLQRHYTVFKEALGTLDNKVCFAVKANSNIAVLATLARAGAGADVVSEGEIHAALTAGVPPSDIVFSGVGKTKEEMAYALEQGIFQFNVESEPELLALNEVAQSRDVKAPIAIRVNPDVAPATHAKISTGGKETKFGVAMHQALDLFNKAAALPHIQLQGVSVHIGSQLTDLTPFESAYKRVLELVAQLRTEGHTITTLDLGGGLGIPYESGSTPPLPVEYGKMVQRVMGGCGCQLIFEPGRLIAGNAGILVMRVIYVKNTGTRKFLICDAGMNDLIRPSMYEAHHDIVSILQPEGDVAMQSYDIVGPVCETGDYFALQRDMPEVKEGELLAIRSAGAYGAVMANSYNARPLVPEILVKGETYSVVCPRPRYEDMLAQQHVPQWVG